MCVFVSLDYVGFPQLVMILGAMISVALIL